MKLSQVMVLLVAACGGGDKDKTSDQATTAASGECPKLAVTVDGKPLEGLAHGQAMTMFNEGHTIHMVTVYNHDKSKCEETLKGQHTSVEGEVSVRAWHSAVPGVGTDAYTHLEGKVTVEKPTEKPGETLALCVREKVTFKPTAGQFEGKEVSIVGLLSGTFCGVNKR